MRNLNFENFIPLFRLVLNDSEMGHFHEIRCESRTILKETLISFADTSAAEQLGKDHHTSGTPNGSSKNNSNGNLSEKNKNNKNHIVSLLSQTFLLLQKNLHRRCFYTFRRIFEYACKGKPLRRRENRKARDFRLLPRLRRGDFWYVGFRVSCSGKRLGQVQNMLNSDKSA